MPLRRSAKILILGVTGMLGNTLLRYLSQSDGYEVVGSARSRFGVQLLPEEVRNRVICDVDVANPDSLTRLFATVQPGLVINCIGLIKQLAGVEDPLAAIPINSLLPHRLAGMCAVANARFVHVSTDCVFSGRKGSYKESDPSDASDLYGRTKYLGEVDYPNAITLRTSIIGHELASANGLVGWFLAQEGKVRGFAKAVFSGLPAVELARVIRDFVIPNQEIHGLHHVSSRPITKYELLQEISRAYGKRIEILRDESFVIDRSLNSELFQATTGYVAPSWPDLIAMMRRFG